MLNIACREIWRSRISYHAFSTWLIRESSVLSFSHSHMNQFKKLSILLMRLQSCQGNSFHSINNNCQIRTSSSTVRCLKNSSEWKQNTSDVEKDDIEEKTIEGRKVGSLFSSNGSVEDCDGTYKCIPSMFLSLFHIILLILLILLICYRKWTN